MVSSNTACSFLLMVNDRSSVIDLSVDFAEYTDDIIPPC